eukprot:TRINITY_DN23007_c0_g1_i1.p1 TRINITY_DN23007_c0_g1~~TRINITY_DN23007_c0_g1_i1.p1  ORF type:complete len:342 (+),score=56.08 TRINITY_DN23007_c0_g1_i1:54-1079(+)
MTAMFEELMINADGTVGDRNKRVCDQSKDTCMGFTMQMLESWAAFAAAPEMERRCVYTVTAATVSADLFAYKQAFASMDRDNDGRVFRRDVITTMASVRQEWPLALNADALFRAADIDCVGAFSFIQFAAACLHAQLAPLDVWLAQEAFASLDKDRDGFIYPQEIVKFFGEVPSGLPASGPIESDLWCHAICDESGERKSSKQMNGLAASVPLMPERSSSSFLQLLFGKCSVESAGGGRDAAQKDDAASVVGLLDLRLGSTEKGQHVGGLQPLCCSESPAATRLRPKVVRPKQHQGVAHGALGRPAGEGGFVRSYPTSTCKTAQSGIYNMSSPTYVPMAAR